ncbi:hypothetical protein EST38_g6184 [Candolleomyces aberdarensis]|uniref:Plus3 domain-containing protein n=1 Tax=Candolleomyces aberdarensis TaxID=2316362 RepID=A0A4Q2DIF5_9AGAR|nr:hypothetical protein EST38_g6184 [Candolleomyces aberdarensis]
MSEFEDDIDDQLLELAGAGEKKERRKSKSSKSNSRKRHMESDSDRDIESEEEDDVDEETADPYPYDGQYLDQADKESLLALPEIKREEILAERSEEKRRLQEKRLLAQMVKQQKGSGGMVVALDEDSVARAAKRQHAVRGATKEKSRKLDELKAKRKAKDESRKRAKLSPTSHRDRSRSPGEDMEFSSEEQEDGMYTKEEQAEERERRLLGLPSSGSRSKEEDEEDLTPATVEDYNHCRLTRDLVAKWCLTPWFQDYAAGSWVRYLIGNEGAEPVYRICQITELAAETVKPYKVNERVVNQAVVLKHGKSTKVFNMDRISNAHFTDREIDRLKSVCKAEHVKLPTRKELQNKRAQMRQLESQPLTEKDISVMLERKKELQATSDPSQLKMKKARLNQARSLAMKRQDPKEVAELDKQLAALQAQLDAFGPENAPGDSREDILRKVNERNRKANVESVRRAELAESERKRKERELAIQAAAQGGAAAGAAVAVKYDPSARLKTVPRLFNAATPTTRPGTPANNSKAGTPSAGTPGPSGSAATPPPNGASTAPGVTSRPLPTNTQMALEQKLLETIDIDLGDF